MSSHLLQLFIRRLSINPFMYCKLRTTNLANIFETIYLQNAFTVACQVHIILLTGLYMYIPVYTSHHKIIGTVIGKSPPPLPRATLIVTGIMQTVSSERNQHSLHGEGGGGGEGRER